MVNTHGLKMIGIKAACHETVDWDFRSGGHTQISYDMETGDLLTSDHIGESWNEYRDRNVITVCHTKKHMTMQQIADAVYFAVCNYKNAMQYC